MLNCIFIKSAPQNTGTTTLGLLITPLYKKVQGLLTVVL